MKIKKKILLVFTLITFLFSSLIMVNADAGVGQHPELWELENVVGDIAAFRFYENIPLSMDQITFTIDDYYNVDSKSEVPYGTIYSKLYLYEDAVEEYSVNLTDLLGADMVGKFTVDVSNNIIIIQDFESGMSMYSLPFASYEVNIDEIMLRVVQSFDYSSPPPAALGNWQELSFIEYIMFVYSNDEVDADEITDQTWFGSILTTFHLDAGTGGMLIFMAISILMLIGISKIPWSLSKNVIIFLILIWLIFATWVGMIPVYVTAIIGLLCLTLIMTATSAGKEV